MARSYEELIPEWPRSEDTAYEAVRLLVVRKSLGIIMSEASLMSPFGGASGSGGKASPQAFVNEMARDYTPGSDPESEHPELFEPYLMYKVNSLLGMAGSVTARAQEKKLAKFIQENPELRDPTATPQSIEASDRSSNVVELRPPTRNGKKRTAVSDLVQVTGFKRLELVEPSKDSEGEVDKSVLWWKVGVVAAASWMRHDSRYYWDSELSRHYRVDRAKSAEGVIDKKVRLFLEASDSFGLETWTSEESYGRITQMLPGYRQSVRWLDREAMPQDYYWHQLGQDLDNLAEYYEENRDKYNYGKK